MVKPGESELDGLLGDVRVDEKNAPAFLFHGKEADIWDDPYRAYHGKTASDYLRERILELHKKGEDPFPGVVGKSQEKAMVKNALLSGSAILFKGRKGYGKTTFSKEVSKLLPEKLLAVQGCKIYDDPTHPSCFSCKRKVLQDEKVEVTWVPRVWMRIPGDPQLTTRQLLGGISIQKIREGFDLDHPEVFIPGRALKANRGIGYYDELGAIPSSLQTLLHELFEEGQVTTTEGDVIPFRIDAIEIAATNPANYRGTNPIKEPLLDRMEEVEIGPPETLEQEMEIGRRNMYLARVRGEDPRMPPWHMEILAGAVRLARDKEESELARVIDSEPSCRATIKLYDHVKSQAQLQGREAPSLADYGERYEVIQLALRGRLEVGYGTREPKERIIEKLVEKAIETACRKYYEKVPEDKFEKFMAEVRSLAKDGALRLTPETAARMKAKPLLGALLKEMAGKQEEFYASAAEILFEAVARCSHHLERHDGGYRLTPNGNGEGRPVEEA
ncbi:MAG: ATPase [Euryarchaeota archaeon]|nr:ATPase [Euryarchaeota archaeon]